MNKAEEKAKIVDAVNSFCDAADAFLVVIKPHAIRHGEAREMGELVGGLSQIRFLVDEFAEQLVSDL